MAAPSSCRCQRSHHSSPARAAARWRVSRPAARSTGRHTSGRAWWWWWCAVWWTVAGTGSRTSRSHEINASACSPCRLLKMTENTSSLSSNERNCYVFAQSSCVTRQNIYSVIFNDANEEKNSYFLHCETRSYDLTGPS